MKNITQTILICLLTIMGVQAQSFDDITGPIKDYWFSASAIGDVDNDGDQDIVVSGAVDTTGGGPDTSRADVYINDNGTFTLSSTFLIEKALHIGDLQLIDRNNDGLLDLVITGLSYDDIVNYQLYTYMNTGTTFELVDEEIGKIYGSIAVSDFDHNGSLDFITNGTQYIEDTGFESKIDFYKNVDGNFEKSVLLEEGSQSGNVAVADFNNDNLLDFIHIGTDADYNNLFKLYANVEGSLEERIDFGTIGTGNVTVADFNADGLLDIVVQGSDENYDPVLKVFFNEGEYNFTEIDMTADATSNSNGAQTIAVGDLNSDGYRDFVTVGEDSDYNGFTKIFLYNPNNQSFEVVTESTGLLGVGGSSYVILKDINNDTQLDLLLSGFADVEGDYTGVTRLYQNISTEENIQPEAPTTLNMEAIDNNTLQFSWDGASDDKTPTEGLEYEIRIGLTSGGKEIANYKVHGTSWMIKLDELPETFYWAVKSIDASKLYSEESEEAVETTLSTPKYTIENIALYPNPANNIISVSGSEFIKQIEVISMDGKRVLTTQKHEGINISSLKSGIYIVNIQMKQQIVSKRLIIN